MFTMFHVLYKYTDVTFMSSAKIVKFYRVTLHGNRKPDIHKRQFFNVKSFSVFENNIVVKTYLSLQFLAI